MGDRSRVEEALVGLPLHGRDGFLLRHPPAVGAVGHEGVVHVGDGHDPRHYGDVGALQSVRITGAVQLLVVVTDDVEGALQCRREGLGHLTADDRVIPDGLGLFGAQGTRLVEDRIGNAYLADVVEDPPDPEGIYVPWGQIHCPAEADREV